MEAFNRRDMDDVDRAVAEKRSCTNSGTQNEDGDAEVRNVKPRFNFDEADDDGAMSYFSDDLQDAGGVEDDAGQPQIVRNQRFG